MKDLTQGSITKALFQLAAFMMVSTIFQTLYFLADLYWVGRLGKEAVAAVGLAGNLMFVVLALSQTLGVGTTTLISHAAGKKDKARINFVFNQSLTLSSMVGVVFAVIAFLMRDVYSQRMSADAITATLSTAYLTWFVPAMALQFPLIAIGSALRGLGLIKPSMMISVATIILNMALAPVLMFGWGTGHPLGVAGTAIATFLSVLVGVIAGIVYVEVGNSGLDFVPRAWPPHSETWGKMAKVGLPAGTEFALMSLYMMLIYGIIRPFGSAAQAGFGIGARVMQAGFMPVIAIAFAAAPLAGQNFGARIGGRVRETFYAAAKFCTAITLVLTLLCHISPAWMIGLFSHDPEVVRFGSEYLRIISWNFLASGLVFTTSSLFQGIGNTIPPLFSSVARMTLFAGPAVLISRVPNFQMRHLWYLAAATVIVQAVVNIWLLHREFDRKLNFADPMAMPASGLAAAE
ncbi:MAG TPA: MATE family efflux transporter [Terriglobales bacterium]|nr:MATE family efflux transporter [Terriglobales bacterium]